MRRLLRGSVFSDYRRKVFDAFGRGNSAVSLGSAESGQAWTANQGTWGVTGGQAYSVTAAAADMVSLDVGKLGRRYSCRMMTPSKAVYGVAFVIRMVDVSNFLRVYLAGPIILAKVVAGVQTNLATSANFNVDGAWVHVVARVDGSRVRVFADNALKVDYTMSAGELALFGGATATRFGLRQTHNAGSVLWNDARVTTR